MHHTESSINVAISQGNSWQAKPLSLEVPDGKRRLASGAVANLGFPAGRKKDCLFNLTDMCFIRHATPIALRTNLEIYWDSSRVGSGSTRCSSEDRTLNPSSADLHYRGYSVINKANRFVPGSTRLQQAFAAPNRSGAISIGYYTRFGEVRELLKRSTIAT